MIKRAVLLVASVGLLAGGVYLIFRVAPLFLDKIGLPFQRELPKAADFNLLGLDGKRIQLADFRDRVVILNFWTSWNETALEQLKMLNEYSKSIGREAVVLAINSQESKETVQNTRNSYAENLPVLMDEEGEAGERYGITVVPLTVFIDKNGFEAARFIGLISLQEIQDQLNKLYN